MISDGSQDLGALTQSVKSSLNKTEKFVNSHRKTNTSLLIASMTFSAISTLIAGITSAAGPVVGSGIEGWRLACTAAAGLGFVSTISTGISQQLKINDRLLEGSQCLGKLRSLDTSITIGSRTREEIFAEYEEIVQSYPKFIA
ncbi:MAG: hypothetical protein P8Y34_10025 [Anaerolineales bacterium]